mgnify:CR=1 FL=1
MKPANKSNKNIKNPINQMLNNEFNETEINAKKTVTKDTLTKSPIDITQPQLKPTRTTKKTNVSNLNAPKTNIANDETLQKKTKKNDISNKEQKKEVTKNNINVKLELELYQKNESDMDQEINSERNINQNQNQDEIQDQNQEPYVASFEDIGLSSNIKQELLAYKREQLSRIVMPWTEKYRPNKLDDLLIDDITKEKLKKIIANKEMPNILITGGPGEGKTSTILLIAQQILGYNYREALLELNASDERGIKTHAQVISFCKKKLHFDSSYSEKYAKHKIILLDEADNMTKKAQQSISNLMEVHKNTTRFAFTCNNSGDIIEAIQSRCIIFRYNKLNQEQITRRLEYICKKENIKYTADGIKALVIISDGDMRNAVNNLQVMYNSFSYDLDGGITQSGVYKLSDKPKPQVIKKILLACYKKDVRTAIMEVRELRDKGYSTADTLNCMQNLIIYNELKEINAEIQHYYLRETSKAFHTINQGIDTELQLNGCIIALCTY